MDVLAHTDWTHERLGQRIDEGRELLGEVREPEWLAIVGHQIDTLEYWRQKLRAGPLFPLPQ